MTEYFCGLPLIGLARTFPESKMAAANINRVVIVFSKAEPGYAPGAENMDGFYHSPCLRERGKAALNNLLGTP